MARPPVNRLQEPSWLPDDGATDQTLVETWLFRLRRKRFRSVRTGHAHDFFVTEIADGVHTIAVTPDDQVVLVSQFRAAAGRDSLETPGGLLEPGEDPREAGARELLEETGYAGDPPQSIGVSAAQPCAADDGRHDGRHPQRPARWPNSIPTPARSSSVAFAPADEILGMIRDGRIEHAVCVAGLLIWLMMRGSGRRNG